MVQKQRKAKRVLADSPEASAHSRAAIASDSELDLLKRLWEFNNQFRATHDAEKVLRSALKLGIELFDGQRGCVLSIPPGRDETDIAYRTPRESVWESSFFVSFLRGQKVTVPPDLMLARIRRHGRMWGALALQSEGADFRWDARQAFSSIGAIASQIVEEIDHERVRQVRARIDQKTLEQVRPKNLFYEILHGIRSLTEYDHSAALLVLDEKESSLEVVAEQIAWQKAKGQNVGLKLSLTPELFKLLNSQLIYGFDRHGRNWTSWNQPDGAALAEFMDYNARSAAIKTENAVLCAPLAARDGLLGVLKIVAIQPGTFGAYEVDLITKFLPQASLCLQNLRRTQSLEMQVLEAERKHAMADLARGVSHDINNALGAVLPLVQQLQDDVAQGDLSMDTASEDLREIERSLQVCRRIFGGMLSFARNTARNASDVHLHHEVDCTLAIIKDGLHRRGIEIAVDVPETLPTLTGVQADIEQLLLNLCTNARDAMESGGKLNIGAKYQNGEIEVRVTDTGCGISAANLAKIQEPFFTTKPTGTGLGLAICRSIVSQMRGRMEINSRVGEGTEVSVWVPVAQEVA